MGKKHAAQVGGRIVDITNLDKPMYPNDGLSKAHVLQYYLRMAPVLLRHIKGRPISFVRYTDGIQGEGFFQKNRPDYAPPWMQDLV
tara:strand:+ start:44 stop:301 length:258 start_codon:yes stop_codon:yes gene_type:complete